MLPLLIFWTNDEVFPLAVGFFVVGLCVGLLCSLLLPPMK